MHGMIIRPKQYTMADMFKKLRDNPAGAFGKSACYTFLSL